MPTYAETTEVLPQHRFDVGKLDRYLAEHLPAYAGGITLTQFGSGHSNPTFFLAFETRGEGRRDYVLRKKPPGKLLQSAHQVDREYRVISALAQSDVPVPRTVILCTDESIIGTMFYIMEAVPGRIFTDATLPDQTPAERSAIFDSMNDVLARLHQVDYRAVGLGDYGREGQYIARQIKRWISQYEAAKTDEIPAMDRLIEYLPRHIPEEDLTSIAHGDYRLGNLIIHPTEPRVIAVLDWELSTLGHPLADLAYNCVGYYMTTRPHGFAGADFVNSGIPDREAYVAAYCRRTDRSEIKHWNFYVAFSLFRLAAIAQGVYKRGLDGIASSPDAIKSRDGARERAEEAWKLVS